MFWPLIVIGGGFCMKAKTPGTRHRLRPKLLDDLIHGMRPLVARLHMREHDALSSCPSSRHEHADVRHVRMLAA